MKLANILGIESMYRIRHSSTIRLYVYLPPHIWPGQINLIFSRDSINTLFEV